MITYNELYEMLRKERYSEQLQQLPSAFMADVASYFEDKKQMAGKDADMFSDAILKTKKQFENAIGLFKELMMRRRKKLLTLAFIAAETGISKRDFENMLDFEKELFDKLVAGIEQSERHISGFLNGGAESKEAKNVLVVFKTDAEEFLGLEGEPLGPFRKGDFANLPIEIANILKKGDKVEFAEED